MSVGFLWIQDRTRGPGGPPGRRLGPPGERGASLRKPPTAKDEAENRGRAGPGRR